MKLKFFSKLFVIICIINLLQKNVNAQGYIPFPEDTNVRWTIFYQYYDQFVCEEKYLFNYRLTGDTIINNLSYKQIYIEQIRFIENTAGLHGCGQPDTFNRYVAAFRQDSLLQKSFIVPKYSTTEFLAYDFSLHVGDTLNSIVVSDSMFICPGLPIIITVIDSVLLNNRYHRIQGFNCFNPIIEGIGWLNDPFGYYSLDAHLVCVKNDTALIFEEPTFGYYCTYFNSIESPKENSKISINYSPERSEFNIRSESKISKIEIFDLTGRIIYSNKPNEYYSKVSTINLPNVVVLRIYIIGNSIISHVYILK